MGTKTAAIAFLLSASILALPAGLTAKGRRGANLVVTKHDGAQVSGELIAVKPDSLLLLTGGTADLSVRLADIHTVRIVRRSRAGRGALIGGLAGALGGAVWGMTNQDSDLGGPGAPILSGAVVGAIGLAVGAFAGAAAGADPTFTTGGRSEAEMTGFWTQLRAQSREGRLPVSARWPRNPAGLETFPPAEPSINKGRRNKR